MSSLRVTSLRGRSNGVSPTLPDGAVVTGVTTSTSAIVGSAVTINSTGIDAGAGIITATSFESTVSTGTAPFVVASTTKVANLNADLLDGKSTANSATGNTVVIRNAAGGFSASDITVQNITGVAATFTGVLTYEDVTNVDSVGLITARSGISVLGAGVTVAGIATFHNGADFNAILIENVNICLLYTSPSPRD